MNAKLAALILLGLVVVGVLFLLKDWNSKPGVPAVPDGTTGQPVVNTPAPATQKNLLTSPQPGRTAEYLVPGISATTPAVQQGTSTASLTPPPANLFENPTMVPTEGMVGQTPTPSGRSSPDFLAPPLKFEKIRIFENDTGTFSGMANVVNTGEMFLNNLVIQWQVVDSSGNNLDQGQISVPNLAPGETSTIFMDGTNPYNDQWEKIIFEFKP